MKVLLVGGTGMLGSDVKSELEKRGHKAVAPSSSELDITDPMSLAGIEAAEWCINCAAYTAVDKAESERPEAAGLNQMGPSYLSRICAMKGIKLLHVSTDFVFDGAKTEPYTEEDRPHPLGVYGITKFLGEEAVQVNLPISLIFRTSWLYGPNGGSFPKTMINAWLAEKNLKVVADQTGCPTYTGDLARTLVDAIEKDIFPGTYHATGPDPMTWHEFATMAIETYREAKGIERTVEITPIKTEDWPTPAERPKYSVLSNAKLQKEGIAPMRPTKEALREFVERL